eukprot:scaffold34401_cov129-Isochrysis_galbana.AAC.1
MRCALHNEMCSTGCALSYRMRPVLLYRLCSMRYAPCESVIRLPPPLCAQLDASAQGKASVPDTGARRSLAATRFPRSRA